MRGKLFFGAATAALLMFVPGALAQQADPPGDATTQARLGDEAIDGAIEPSSDSDWYRLRVEQGRAYTVTLEGVPREDGTALDPTLTIYDTQGNQLAFNDDSNGTLNASLRYAPTQSGEVLVAADAFMDNGTGAYRLAVTSGEIPPDDASGDAATRARVAPGRPVTGNIEYGADTDWYRLSTRRGQSYHITLRGGEGEGALGDPMLRVIDSEGNELASNDDDGEGLNSALDYAPQANGDVFVEARAFNENYTGAYTLAVTASRAPTDSISADRNTRGRVSVGGTVDGALDFANDLDWYRVRLEEGQSYRFTLASAGDNPLGDPLIRLRNASGEEVAMDDDGGDGLNSYLEFTAPSTGNYYVETAAFGEGATGGYTLAARGGDIPADSSTDASLSADGDYREGVLGTAGDSDWYKVQLNEGQGMRVSLASAQAGEVLADPMLVLHGPDGAEIVRDDDGGDGLNAWLEYSATTAGTYFIEARGFTEDAVGRYALSITAGEIGAGLEGAEYLAPGMEGRMSRIGEVGDSDWFTVEMIEGRPYRFNLEGAGDSPLADPVLTLYNSNGEQIVQDDDGGSGLSSYLTFASPTGGSYFAAVSSFDGGTGGYVLRVSDTDVPGHIYTDETLSAVAEGDDRISRIDMEGDLDYFRVELEGGVRYRIEVNGNGASPLADPFLTIGNEENTTITSDDDSGSGRDARLVFTPETSGVYFIQASGLGGSLGQYQVSIVRQ